MRPFVGTEALAAGVVTRYQLKTRYRAIFRNVYVAAGREVTPVDKAIGAWLWSGRRATAAGLSAAALHGTRWISSTSPAELNQPSRHKTPGILLHSDTLAEHEVCVVRGVPATTPARTAFDLGRRGGVEAAVIRIDALIRPVGPQPRHPAAGRLRSAGLADRARQRRHVEVPARPHRLPHARGVTGGRR
jgi:hypothetical protein